MIFSSLSRGLHRWLSAALCVVLLLNTGDVDAARRRPSRARGGPTARSASRARTRRPAKKPAARKKPTARKRPGTRKQATSSKKARANKKSRVRSLKSKLGALKQATKQQQARIRQTKQKQRRFSDLLQETYEKLEAAQDQLDRSALRVRLVMRQVSASTARLERAEKRLQEQQDRVGKRLSVSYQEGPVSFADVMLGARNMSDFLDRQYYINCIMRQDATLLRELDETRQTVVRERAYLLRRQDALAEAHRENARFVVEVQVQAKNWKSMLIQLRKERIYQEERLAQLEEDSANVQRSLEDEAARRRANPGSFRGLPRWSGRLARPANGPIRSRFGYRYHPILGYSRLHTGVDIGAGSGSPVFAAAGGEVFSTGWRGGYGKCIIVLHGDGVSTLYAHLSRIDVRSGQPVERGQRIGAVGSTGLSTGPHLHFEVRRNGVPVNPM